MTIKFWQKKGSEYEKIVRPNLYLWKIDAKITDNQVYICDSELHYF